jgi:hypothetical protein
MTTTENKIVHRFIFVVRQIKIFICYIHPYQNVLVSDLKHLKIFMRISDFQSLNENEQQKFIHKINNTMLTDDYELFFRIQKH